MFLVKIGRINLSFDVSIVTNFIDQHNNILVTAQNCVLKNVITFG